MKIAVHLSLTVVTAVTCAACASRGPALPASAPLAAAESLYADLRAVRDRIDISAEARRTGASHKTPLSALVLDHNKLTRQLWVRLAAIDPAALRGEDARAFRLMRHTLEQHLDSLIVPGTSSPATRPDCTYDAKSIASAGGPDSLRKRIYSCYAWAQSHLAIGEDTLDRLSILGMLGRTDDPGRRRNLFLALEPVWRSVNGDNGPGSPYRRLIATQKSKRGRELLAKEQVRASGLPPDSLESWLLTILTTWRDANADSLVEPWDWYFETGRTNRVLSPRISRERLAELNAEVYRSLGANVDGLGVQYDLDPREGKTPVAYCTFGRRPRFINGAWHSGEPWVFASYRTGGLDNLNELLHETGHAIHIAAIRTRPAFADWPDSDTFTEAVAEFVALDVYEPAWQQRWLGDSVSLREGLRARYGGIVFDVAWALFEIRMQRNPAADPNRVWTALTSDYLRIRPHPELSWWAMRGQLIDAPGYMLNYAAGAILIADLRARTRELRGSSVTGDSRWYSWVGPRLYRFGLERPTRQVLLEFLGRPPSPAALLDDMRRMRP